MTNRKETLKKWGIAAVVSVFFALAATGCGKSEETAAEEEAVIYPLSIDGSEIRIGETTVQALLDKGFKMTVSEMSEDYEITQYEIDPEEVLEANSYYSGASIWLSDSSFAHISIVTDEENIRMGDAVIAYLELNPNSEDAAVLNKIQFNGIPLSELDREKAKEAFPDFDGDDNMWFSPYTMLEYKYFMAFDWEGTLHQLSLERKYDVDWNS